MISKVSFSSINPHRASSKNLTERQKAYKAWVDYFNSHLLYLNPSEDGDTFEPQEPEEEEYFNPFQSEELDEFYKEIDRRLGDE